MKIFLYNQRKINSYFLVLREKQNNYKKANICFLLS